MFTTPRPHGAMPQDVRARLVPGGAPVSFTAGQRIFEEQGRADRFWLIRSGTVHLDLHVPTRSPVVVDTLRPGEMLGCSWLFPPCRWHLGATAGNHVSALEFDAAAIRDLCDADAEFGRAMARYAARTALRRLERAHARLLDVYGPLGVRHETLGPATEDAW